MIQELRAIFMPFESYIHAKYSVIVTYGTTVHNLNIYTNAVGTLM